MSDGLLWKARERVKYKMHDTSILLSTKSSASTSLSSTKPSAQSCVGDDGTAAAAAAAAAAADHDNGAEIEEEADGEEFPSARVPTLLWLRIRP